MQIRAPAILLAARPHGETAVVARMLTHRFATMLWLSTVIGAACGLVGMNLSYHLDVASGPTIVLVGGVLFVVALVVSGRRGRVRLGRLATH